MLCFKRFSYLSVFVFSVFVCTLLSTTITSGDVFALDDLTLSLGSTWTNICSDWTSDDNTLCGYDYVVLDGVPNSVRFTCRGSYPGNTHTWDFATDYTKYAILSSFNIGSGFTYDSFECRHYSISGNFINVTFTNNPFGSSPSGSLSITENGTYDVTSYASAVVDVPPIMGDYHDDLVNIKKAIYTGCAVLLVLYFFYCIYRMIIKGVKK